MYLLAIAGQTGNFSSKINFFSKFHFLFHRQRRAASSSIKPIIFSVTAVKVCYLFRGLKGTLVNPTCHSLHEGSLELTL